MTLKLFAPLLFIAFGLFGVNVEMWAGRTHTGKTAVVAGQGTATVKIYYRRYTWDSWDQRTGDQASTTGSTLVTATYERGSTQDGSIAFYATNSETGYTFSGWYSDAACTNFLSNNNPYVAEGKNTSSSGVTKTAYAKFTPTDVTFDANGGSVGTSTKTVTDGSTYGTLPSATRTGYTFVNWYTEASNGTVVTPSTTVTNMANHTLYAHWTANTYTVAFDGNGSTKGSVASIGATYDQNVTLAANNYIKHQYIVTYDADGGSSVGPDSTLYTFLGWNTEDDGTGDNYLAGATLTKPNFTATQGDTYTLYAKWSDAVASASITLPAAPTKSGYQFEGWYDGDVDVPANKAGDAGDSYTPSDDVTLTARWVEKYDFEVTGSNFTINNEDWNKVDLFTFVHADKANMTVNIGSSDVISYDVESNTITAKKIGTSTISFTQNASSTINTGTSSEWTITVDSVANTLTVSSTSFTKYVEETIPSVRSNQNSNGTISSTSSNPNLAYYDKNDNTIYIPNSDAQTLPLGDVTIIISQAATAKYKAKKDTITLTVQKYQTSFTGSAYNSLLVENEQTADYSYTYVSAAQPTASSDDDFFYAIEDISYTNSSLNKKYNSLDSLVRFVPSTKKIVPLNAGTGKITLRQKETYKFTGDTVSFDVTVSKHDNHIFINGTADSKAFTLYTDKDYAVTLTADNSADGCPTIEWEQTSGSTYVTYDGSEVHTNYLLTPALSPATWTMSQSEDYKYKAAEAAFTVAVQQASADTSRKIYIYESESNDGGWKCSEFGSKSWEPIGIAVKLWFDAKKTTVWSRTLIPQQYVNGSWSTADSKIGSSLDNGTFKNFNKELNANATAIKFDPDGKDGDLYVRNVKVEVNGHLRSNAANNNTDTIRITNQADGTTPVYTNTEGKNQMTIYYGLAYNSGDLKVKCDNSKFSFTDSRSATHTIVSNSALPKAAKAAVNVYYAATGAGNDTAHVLIYNDVYRHNVVLVGQTIKRTPEVTAPTAKELTYTGSAQNLVNAGSTTGGTTLQYALGAGEFSTSIPQATNAGDYTVYYKVIENDDYYGTDPVGVSASIAKANSVLNSAPTAEEDLVYTGSAQSLVSAGTATNGTLQYALGEGEFSTSIPQATDAGTYTVNYKVVGDANYNDVAASSLEVTIDKANSSISTAPTAKELTYTGSAQNLVNAGTATGGTLQYALGEGEFSTSIPQATAIGSYTVYYRVAANDNYNGIDAEDLAVTISPKASSIEEESSWEDVDEYTAVAVPESINVVIEDTVSVYSLDIDESSTFTIAPTGCLRVGEGGITGASAERLILQAVTDIKEATLGQTSAILFSPDYEGAMPTAKVEMYSVGYKDMTNPSVNRWQYVGVPINKADYAAKTAFPRSLVRSWDESEPDEADGWKNTRNTLKLQPFMGIATTYYFGSDGCKMTFEGQLAANRGTQVVNLTHSGNGWNLIANSFAGPIDVTKLTTDDFGGATATLYIWDTQSQDYVELPVATIAELKDRQHVVPSMQAFFVYTESATTLSLNYERLVWNGEESNVPLKAKRRENGESSVNAKMYISITDGVSTDNLCLLESQNYDAAYENGYDAPKKFSDADVNAIYSIKDDYLLSVDATNSIAGTKLGLRTRESDFYLMTFTLVEGDGEWYLLDKNTEEKVRIREGMEYEFTASPNSTIEGRFEIVGTANTPAITTEVDNTDAAQKAEKYIKDNTLVILKGGTKYNSLGQKIQ